MYEWILRMLFSNTFIYIYIYWPRLTNHSLPPKWRWFVQNIISPGLPPLKKIAANKHVFAKLPLVTPFISNLTRLTAVVCMKVRFEAKVTRGFSLSSSLSRLVVAASRLALDLFREEKSRKTSGTRVVKKLYVFQPSSSSFSLFLNLAHVWMNFTYVIFKYIYIYIYILTPINKSLFTTQVEMVCSKHNFPRSTPT